jgi:hypothetical protein
VHESHDAELVTEFELLIDPAIIGRGSGSHPTAGAERARLPDRPENRAWAKRGR